MCRDEKITNGFDCECDDEDDALVEDDDDEDDDEHEDVESDAVASNSNRRKPIVLARRLNLDDELTSRDRHRRRDRRYQRSIEDTFPYRSDAKAKDVLDEDGADDDDCKVSMFRSTSDGDNHRMRTRTRRTTASDSNRMTMNL